MLLVIDANKLDAELIYEESEPGQHFPHLYGSLDLDAVTQSLPFQPDPDGFFSHPDDLNVLRTRPRWRDGNDWPR